jgi:hypothetical protein
MMTTAIDEKIQNVFIAEFPEIFFEVFSENGQINEKSRMFTVFVESELVEKERPVIEEFAKTVFDEVFLQPGNDTHMDMCFFGLLIDKGE